jgi:hypothetical protein
MSFGKANIAGVTGLASLDSLGEGPFNTGALVIEGLESGSSLALTGCLHGIEEGLGREGEAAWASGPAGAARAQGTGATDTLAKLDVNDGTAPKASLLAPGMARLTSRASHLMLVPVNVKVGNIEGLFILRLPAHVGL